MISVRATKFNPKNRDDQGRYLVDEFTSISDIGKTYDNHQLTPQLYILNEDSYVNCVRNFMTAAGIKRMWISDLEDKRRLGKCNIDVERLRPTNVMVIYDGMSVEEENIDKIVRLNLRELIWCKLIDDNGSYVHFGYDFYMYIRDNSNSLNLAIPPQGIFYEEIASPYE